MSYIVLPRKRRRPLQFELDYGHPLAQGLTHAFWQGDLLYTNMLSPDEIRLASLEYPAFSLTEPVWRWNSGNYSWTIDVTPSAAGILLNTLDPSAGGIRVEIYDTRAISVYEHGAGVATSATGIITWGRRNVVTMTRVPGTITVYLNGMLVCTRGSYSDIVHLPLRIGGAAGVYHNFLRHTRALSPEEIKVLANKTDPMLAGLIKEKRTAPIYSLPSVNHWELQIKVGEEGEWVEVPNIDEDITEYIKTDDLTTSVIYARLRKFTNGVPSAWEYSAGIEYSAGTGGTPYSLVQSLLASIGTTLIVFQDQDLKVSTEYTHIQDSLGTISKRINFIQSSLSKISRKLSDSFDSKNSLSFTFISNFDGKEAISLKTELTQDAISKVSRKYNLVADSRSTIYSQLSYILSIDSLSKISEEKTVKHDALSPISFTYNLFQDTSSSVSVIGHWSITVDCLAKIHTNYNDVQDFISKVSSAISANMDTSVSSSLNIYLNQDIKIQVKTALLLSFDSSSKVATTYEEFQDIISGISSGYAVIQDGKVNVIIVDFEQMPKVDFDSYGITVIAKESKSLVIKAFESGSKITIVKI